MPTATFITVPAHKVRQTDDLLINLHTKEFDENGEPMAQSESCHVGHTWVYFKLAQPLGRRRTIRSELYDAVPIIRMVDTYEDKVHKLEGSIVDVALYDQRNYWRKRQQLAKAALDVRDRHNTWRHNERIDFAPASTLADITKDLEEWEYFVSQWQRVDALLRDPRHEEADNLVAAVVAVRAIVTDELVQGFRSTDIDHARRWLRNTKKFETMPEKPE